MIYLQSICHVSYSFTAMLVHIGQKTHLMSPFDHTLRQLVTIGFDTTYFWCHKICSQKYAIFGITLKNLAQSSLFIKRSLFFVYAAKLRFEKQTIIFIFSRNLFSEVPAHMCAVYLAYIGQFFHLTYSIHYTNDMSSCFLFFYVKIFLKK